MTSKCCCILQKDSGRIWKECEELTKKKFRRRINGVKLTRTVADCGYDYVAYSVHKFLLFGWTQNIDQNVETNCRSMFQKETNKKKTMCITIQAHWHIKCNKVGKIGTWKMKKWGWGWEEGTLRIPVEYFQIGYSSNLGWTSSGGFSIFSSLLGLLDAAFAANSRHTRISDISYWKSLLSSLLWTWFGCLILMLKLWVKSIYFIATKHKIWQFHSDTACNLCFHKDLRLLPI